MGVKGKSIWPARVALLLLSCFTSSAVAAQTSPAAETGLDSLLAPGMTVWITDSNGQEDKTRIVSVSGGIVTTSTGGEVRRLRSADITRVRARHSDPVINGALIGAGAAVASGLLMCRAMEPWENCRDDAGPMVRIGALGAGIGIVGDVLIRGRRTIYEASPGTLRVQAAPIVARHVRGVQVSISF